MFLDAARARRTGRSVALSRRATSIACLFLGAGLLHVTNVQRDAETKAHRAEETAALMKERATLERDIERIRRKLSDLHAEQAGAQ
ncbi:hypothetical protein DDF67_08265 [Caulobacter endophyticus]|uniref:Uncharacterized protein n=2 Tax=Caulobacter endophyticus TaxID=2172652 RepID=A0A2T9K4M1_9CAUL|nr:hypothetical protein DDF67_08265 [Caulobacter endophyticus]